MMQAIKAEKLDLPEWIENFRLPDMLAQEAYDKFGANARSLIKTAIALAQYHFSPPTGIDYIEKINPTQAFCAISTSWPASCAFLIFPESYDSAALACAAAIMPQLCELSHIYAICLCDKPSFSILATLELCGIEDIFCLKPDQCLRLLKGLTLPRSHNKNINPVRAIILDFNSSLSELYIVLQKILPTLYLNKKPIICVQNHSSCDQNLLRLLLGSELILEKNPQFCDAIYIDSWSSAPKDLITTYEVPLILTPPCAAFWIFPELKIEFFRMNRLCFDLFDPLIYK